MAERVPAAARRIRGIFIIPEEDCVFGMVGSDPVTGRIRPKTAGAAQAGTPLSQNSTTLQYWASRSHANFHELGVQRVINTQEPRPDRG